MALLNNRYTDKHLSPMPFQTLKAGIFSAIGMCLMSLVTMICNKDNVSINGFTDDYMVTCLFIVFWFNNVNVISLVLFHYLKISTTLIYNPVGVVVEGALYYLLARVALHVDQLNMASITVLPVVVITICLSIKSLLYRIINSKSRNEKSDNNIVVSSSDMLGKKADLIISLFLPLFPIIIILLNVLAG